MSRIFISYSRKDEIFARRIASSLSEAGAEIWIDVDDIPVGMNWSTAIQAGLDQCEIMVMIISPDSMESANVENEWQYFQDHGKKVVPLLWKPAKMHFQVNRLQYVDFQNQTFQVAFRNLLQKLGFAQKEIKIRGFELPLLDWCEIPGREILYFDRPYRVASFYMAQYPVTNAQYQIFLDDVDGFRNVEWWGFSSEAQKWRKDNPGPIVSRFSGNLCPREMVTWYEAMAFCNWLSEKLGKSITLPTQLQRVRVVQGDTGRLYPWGNEFDLSKCNVRESLIRRTTSVMKYPEGASQHGVMDLSGNVWEWSLTQHPGMLSFGSEFHRSVQKAFGGGWRGRPRHATSAFLRWHSRGYYAPDLGFRVCMEW